MVMYSGEGICDGRDYVSFYSEQSMIQIVLSMICDECNYVSVCGTWWQDYEDQSYDEQKYAPVYNWSRTLWRLRECVARSAVHVGDVQQARRLRGDPTCLVPVVFVSHDGQREVFR